MTAIPPISTSDAVDASLAAIGSKSTYAGASMTVTGWLLSSEFAVLVGMLLGIAGFGVNWYYRHKLTHSEIQIREAQELRAREEHAAKMEMYR